MKYIKKQATPDFFITDIANLTHWRQYGSVSKQRLKKFILDNEQYNLCCYCEKNITIDNTSSHIEHIKPKSIDTATLTFDYKNLLVSCEGNHFNEIGDTSKNTCGHTKSNTFDEIKFLNPTRITDIATYFIFDSDTGVISASPKDEEKAAYTCEVLNLNGKNDKLAEARKKAKQALIRNFAQFPIDLRKKKLRTFLANEGSEFVTFFRYVFRKFLKQQ